MSLLLTGGLGCKSASVATVMPRLQVSPSGLTFPLTPYGGQSSATVTLEAVSLADVQVSLAVSGPDQTAFSVKPAGPLSVPGGQSEPLLVTFAPALPSPVPGGTQSFSAMLTFTSNDPMSPTSQVALSGSAAAPRLDLCWVQDAGGPQCLSAGPLTVQFGTVPLGMTGGREELDLKDIAQVPLVVSQFGLDAEALDAGFQIVESLPALPLTLSAQTGTTSVFHVVLHPLGSGSAAGNLVAFSDDPNAGGQPVKVALAARVQAAQGPTACLGINEIDYINGLVANPNPAEPLSAQPTVVPPGPLDSVVVTAEVSPSCSFDPQNGQNLAYAFTLAPPAGSLAQLSTPTGHAEERKVQLDLSGNYVFGVKATDSVNLSATQSLTLPVAPQSDLEATVTWDQPDFPQGLVDLDLHLVRQVNPGGATSSLVTDPQNDCFFCNCVLTSNTPLCSASYPTSLNWDNLPTPLVGNPLLVANQREEPLPNEDLDDVRLQSPQAGATYGLYVHYYGAYRHTPSSDGGIPAPIATLSLFVDGQNALDGGAVLTQQLSSPCQLWHAADILWASGGHLGDGGFSPPVFTVLPGSATLTKLGALGTDGLTCDVAAYQ